MSHLYALKFQYGQEVRRLGFSEIPTFDQLLQKLAEVFTLSNPNGNLLRYRLRYYDAEGDLITLTTDGELAELINSGFQAKLLLTDEPHSSKANANAHAQQYQSQQPQYPQFRAQNENMEDSTEGGSGQQREKGKEKDKEEEEEKQDGPNGKEPTFEEIFEGFHKLGTHVQGIFEQHPEIQQEATRLTRSFQDLLFQEIRQHSQQAQQGRGGEEEGPYGGCFFRQRGFGNPWGRPFMGCHPYQKFHHYNQQRFDRSNDSINPNSNQQQEETLATFEDMGFIDRELNAFLLKKHNGNINSVVAELSEINSRL